MASSTQRFETVNDLYYRTTGRLRPGKSVAPEQGYDSSSEENVALFENWVATRAFTDAVDHVAILEARMADLVVRLEEADPDCHLKWEART